MLTRWIIYGSLGTGMTLGLMMAALIHNVGFGVPIALLFVIPMFAPAWCRDHSCSRSAMLGWFAGSYAASLLGAGLCLFSTIDSDAISAGLVVTFGPPLFGFVSLLAGFAGAATGFARQVESPPPEQPD